MIWVFPIHSTSIKKNTKSSVIFLRNDVLILSGKENKEASAICFEIRIPKKKNEELLRKVPSKIYEVHNFIMEKNKKKFPNIITEQWGYGLNIFVIVNKSYLNLRSISEIRL